MPAPLGLLPLVATYAGAQVAAALLVGVLAGLWPGGSGAQRVLAVQLTYGLSSLVLLGVTWAALRLWRVPPASRPPVRWPGLRWAGLGLLCGVVAKFAGDALTLLEAHLAGPVHGNNPLVLYPHAFARPLPLLVLGGALVVAAPLAEELFFRGLVYGWLRGRLAPLPAALLCAAIFAAAHGSLGLAPPLLLLGLVLCWLYERSGSLWAPALAHAAVNAAALALALRT